MIGFFDSGFGGLNVMREAVKLLPRYSYLYLGDNARAPYGNQSQEEIFKYTLEGVEFLISQGAKIVVLACNTASSLALRRIQREILPQKYPEKKVLGIIIPTAEDFENFTKSGAVGILATPATVESEVYQKESQKYWPTVEVFQQACPNLVPLIEKGETGKKLNEALKKYLQALFAQSDSVDAIVLGCTHYALIADQIKKLSPKGAKIILQGKIIAKKLKDYLKRHQELEKDIEKKGRRIFFTTGNAKKVENLAAKFYGKKIRFQKIVL